MNVSLEYRIGDVFDRLAEIPDGSIDLIVSSPPFLALRSYLPADHPDKNKEIGSEPTPAAFIDTHLALSAEYARVLAPHGSLCYEIGDTYSGSGGAGGDYNTDGLRAGQEKFSGSARRSGDWPLAKSMCLIPHAYTMSLAYGRNIITGTESPAGMWRIRNVICWARPNPPVGALGDKFRPATSYITVACKGSSRYFDLDAVRNKDKQPNLTPRNGAKAAANPSRNDSDDGYGDNPAGAPPLDWHTDHHPEDGDWLWKLPTQPYRGSHYATFPMTLPKRLIEAMCPLKVCNVCGKPSERIVGDAEYVQSRNGSTPATLHMREGTQADPTARNWSATGIAKGDNGVTRVAPTLGWTDCECSTDGSHWRTGIVLDPFGGSGTTLEAAQALGRSAIGIDLDSRNADLARERVGMFLEVIT